MEDITFIGLKEGTALLKIFQNIQFLRLLFPKSGKNGSDAP
jgi:hypothetical protein